MRIDPLLELECTSSYTRKPRLFPSLTKKNLGQNIFLCLRRIDSDRLGQRSATMQEEAPTCHAKRWSWPLFISYFKNSYVWTGKNIWTGSDCDSRILLRWKDRKVLRHSAPVRNWIFLRPLPGRIVSRQDSPYITCIASNVSSSAHVIFTGRASNLRYKSRDLSSLWTFGSDFEH